MEREFKIGDIVNYITYSNPFECKVVRVHPNYFQPDSKNPKTGYEIARTDGTPFSENLQNNTVSEAHIEMLIPAPRSKGTNVRKGTIIHMLIDMGLRARKMNDEQVALLANEIFNETLTNKK